MEEIIEKGGIKIGVGVAVTNDKDRMTAVIVKSIDIPHLAKKTEVKEKEAEESEQWLNCVNEENNTFLDSAHNQKHLLSHLLHQ